MSSGHYEEHLQNEVERLTAELAVLRARKPIVYAPDAMAMSDRVKRLEAELAAARGGLDAAVKDTLKYRGQVATLREALADFVSYGCPACGGDCASANPPVALCPMQNARAVLKETGGE
jgi:uncharacterized small protein (DUF1192 family)